MKKLIIIYILLLVLVLTITHSVVTVADPIVATEVGINQADDTTVSHVLARHYKSANIVIYTLGYGLSVLIMLSCVLQCMSYQCKNKQIEGVSQ
ncbi:MAG: hypothetical protein HRT89_02935 [Lentisphaeria bacterium]|nr:hypothetical protein [Lentisphaeria bacterium]NQZ67004.1 hypothetical protein [Lentisphaeria bacterium]